jgi:predicted glutamine amidotransferase
MCIAILNKPQILLPFEYIEESLFSNPDGFGMIYVKSGQIVIKKSLSQRATKIYKMYKEAREQNPLSNIVLHFRVSTAGKIDLTNCHPFTVNTSLAFVHNGVIGRGCINFSDTYHFNKLLQKLPSNFIESHGIMDLISERVTGSKLVFLSSANVPTIVNEYLGHYDSEGNWFSNDSYLPYIPQVYTAKKWTYKKTKIDRLQDEIFGYGHEVEQWNF